MITIITPSYNCKSTFCDSLKAVLSQTYFRWQWIIVDDCSTDGSIELIKQMTKGNSQIVVLQTPKNSGAAVARNLGLKHATGRYITFLDSDDLLDPTYLEKQLEFIKKHGPLITASYRRKAEHTTTNFIVPDVTDYSSALKGNPLSCLTTMYDRSVIGDVYFPEDLKRHEDYVFWLEILKKGIKAYGNQEVLATYVIHPGSKNYNKFKLLKHMYVVYHKTQKFNWLKSWICTFRYALYSRKKYKNVR